MKIEQKKALCLRMLVLREVALQGSFTAAADALGLTKSGVSQYVSQLEQSLGLQLLVRSTRSLSLTQSGHNMLTRAHEVSNLLELTVQEAQALTLMPTGPLRVTTPEALAQAVVLPAIQELVRRFPDIAPDLRVEDAVVDLVRGGIDLAIRVGTLTDSALRARATGVVQGLAVAAPRYLASAPPVSRVADLANHPFAAAPWQHHCTAQALYDADGVRHDVPCRVSCTFNSSSLLRQWVLQGNGYAVLPDVLVGKDLADGALIHVANAHERAEPVYTVHAFQGPPPIAVQFLQTLIEQRLAIAVPAQSTR